jgi:ubiquinone/menaquinone biosynthesis C-methylase UbiE
MSLARTILLRMFGRPRGGLGRLGGHIMARTNAEFGTWVSDLLQIAPTDNVLEVGFGPGVVIDRLASLVSAGHVAGIDSSSEMVEQARVRNLQGIRSGRVDLQCGSVESLPFADASFDKALAVNSLQVWPDAVGGLKEIRRVMKPGSKIALGFTRHSGRSKDGLTDTVVAAGFTAARILEQAGKGFCVLATKP